MALPATRPTAAFPSGAAGAALSSDQLLEIYYYLRSQEHTSELQSPCNLVCRLLLVKNNKPPWPYPGTREVTFAAPSGRLFFAISLATSTIHSSWLGIWDALTCTTSSTARCMLIPRC